jgi:hypothetical protein
VALPTTYLSRLADIHGRFRPSTYLEIGVCSGRSLALARSETIAFGVDPAPELTERLASSSHLYAETSDRFFADADITHDLRRTPLELVFIDGLHLFEAALKDFVNAARHCARGARIVMHDTLPHDAQMALRDRETQAWTGDVWKVATVLRRYCPSLEITTIDTAPTGLTVIAGIDPDDTTLLDGFDRIVSEFRDVGFDHFQRFGRADLNVVPDETRELERLIPARS